MPTLLVPINTTDYTGGVGLSAGTTIIDFTGVSGTAQFLASQFGGLGPISNAVQLTHSGGTTSAVVNVTMASAGTFSAAAWTFGTWGASDEIRLTGSSGADSIVGSARADTLDGGVGIDQLQGGEGDDVLISAAGNTRELSYAGFTGIDTLIFDRSSATTAVTLNGSSSSGVYTIGDVGGNWTNSGIDVFTATGGLGNDYLGGLGLRDTLIGGDGDDQITGDINNYYSNLTSGVGGDSLVGGNGNDIVEFGLQSITTDIIFSLSSQVTSTFTFANGTSLLGFERAGMFTGSGNDSLTGLTGDDFFFGNGGNDTIDGGLGIDGAYGGDGDDIIISGVGNTKESAVIGEAGIDTLVVDRSSATVNFNFPGVTATNGITTFTDVGGAWGFLLFERFSFTGGSGNDNIRGAILGDTLIGGAGDDTINASDGGVDLLDGGAGSADLLQLDRTADVTALALNITNIGASSFAFVGGTTATGFERLSLLAGTGNDSLTGGALDDTLNGGGGSDTINGGGGVDVLNGSLGIDTLILRRNALAGAIVLDANSTASQTIADSSQIQGFEVYDIESGFGNDVLGGGAFNDRLIGNGGRDALTGGFGDDLLFGGDGIDTLDGGEGIDRLSGDAGFDILDGGNGNDTLDGGLGNDTLDAGSGNDSAVGGDGFDVIDAGAGNDILLGGIGNDTLLGGADADFVYGGFDDDLADGGTGSDTMLGEAGNDTLKGNDGNDFVFGGSGQNVLEGGAGADVLNSEGLADTMSGGDDGNKYYRLAAGTSLTTGGSMVDEFIGGSFFSNDSVYGGGGNDYLYGGGGDDLLVGEAGDDVLIGQAGNDTLDGGAGVNLLWANDAGKDQIRFNAIEGGTQVVEFFGAGSGLGVDVLRMIGSGLTTFADYSNLVANAGTTIGGNMVVNAVAGVQIYTNIGAANQGAIWVQGVSMYGLQADNFLFG
jgi:Ca2+-binding RTX toxin-like protein